MLPIVFKHQVSVSWAKEDWKTANLKRNLTSRIIVFEMIDPWIIELYCMRKGLRGREGIHWVKVNWIARSIGGRPWNGLNWKTIDSDLKRGLVWENYVREDLLVL